MDPISAALAAGAAASLTDGATQAVRDAYGRLKGALIRRFPQLGVHVQALEARPDSQFEQSSLSDELVESAALRNAELLYRTLLLLEAIAQDAPEAAVRAGVDLERVRAHGYACFEAAAGDRVTVGGDRVTVGGDRVTVGPAEKSEGAGYRGRRKRRPAKGDLEAWTDKAVADVTPGRFAFNPPAKMRQGKVERVTVALVRSKDLDRELLARLRGSGIAEVVDIDTSPLMKVELRGDPAFTVTPLSELEQPVSKVKITSWEFDVLAQHPGVHVLTVCVALRLPIAGRDDVRLSVPVLERSVQVSVARLYVTKEFLKHNWQWLIATGIALGGVIVALVKVLHR